MATEAVRIEAALDITTIKGIEKLEKQLARGFKGTFVGDIMKSAQGITSQIDTLSSIAKQAGAAGATAKGAGAAAGAAGAGAGGALAAVVGPLVAILGILFVLKAAFDIMLGLIDKGLRASEFGQKAMTAYLKIIGLIMKPIGDIIGGIFYSLIRIMIPYVRMQMMLWRPFQQQMMEGIAGVLNATDDPIRRMVGISNVIASAIGSFILVMQGMVVTEIVKAIVNLSIKVAQVIVTTIGGLALIFIKSFFTLTNVLLALIPGGGAMRGAVGKTEEDMLTGARAGFGTLVGLLEVVNQTAQISADVFLSQFVESLITGNDNLITLTGTLANWSTALGALAGTFDTQFGTVIQNVITTVEQKAAELSTQLDTSGFDLDTFTTGILDMTTAMVAQVQTDSATIKTDWLKMFFSLFASLSKWGGEMVMEWEKLLGISPTGVVGVIQFWAVEIVGSFKTMLGHIVDEINKFLKATAKVSASVSAFGQTYSASASGTVQGKIGDAIVAPGGKIISTHPKDYLIATKNPKSLVGGAKGGTTIHIGKIEVHGQKNTKELVREISKELQYELRGRLSYGVG